METRNRVERVPDEDVPKQAAMTGDDAPARTGRTSPALRLLVSRSQASILDTR
jgi:hypothetical protein